MSNSCFISVSICSTNKSSGERSMSVTSQIIYCGTARLAVRHQVHFLPAYSAGRGCFHTLTSRICTLIWGNEANEVTHLQIILYHARAINNGRSIQWVFARGGVL